MPDRLTPHFPRFPSRWEHTRKHCLMSFDLNHQVGDVAWTPVT